MRLGCYVIFFTLVLLSLRAVGRVMLKNWVLMILLLYIVASSAWSIEPATSLLRSVSLVATACFGLWLATRLSLRELLTLTALVLAASMVLSFILATLVPGIGTSPPPQEGAWRGVFMHRNSLGAMTVLNMLIVLLLLLEAGRWKALLWADFVLSLVLLVGSGAKSPIVVGTAVLITLGLVHLLRQNRRYLLPGLALGTSAIILLMLNFDALLDLLGRDASLTGRINLWAALVDVIKSNWLLGYGFEAFWADHIGPLRRVVGAINWQPSHAHNQFLEVWVGLGIVGLALFFGLFISAIVRAWAWLPDQDYLHAGWSAGYLVSVALHSLSEGYLLDGYLLTWPLFVATIAYIRPPITAPRRQPVTPLRTVGMWREPARS
jgi:exopolysaccharide production protein ExoQ